MAVPPDVLPPWHAGNIGPSVVSPAVVLLPGTHTVVTACTVSPPLADGGWPTPLLSLLNSNGGGGNTCMIGDDMVCSDGLMSTVARRWRWRIGVGLPASGTHAPGVAVSSLMLMPSMVVARRRRTLTVPRSASPANCPSPLDSAAGAPGAALGAPAPALLVMTEFVLRGLWLKRANGSAGDG